MTKRGELIKEPFAGPGLVLVDGRQYPFTLQDDWRSPATPRIGMAVDVFVHPQAGVVAVQPMVHAAPAPSAAAFPAPASPQQVVVVSPSLVYGDRPVRPASGSAFKTVVPEFVALAALLAGWFVLPSIRFGALLSAQFTFWQLLSHLGDLQSLAGADTSISLNSGLVSALALIALAGPFLFLFWKNRFAALGGVLPLVLMLLVGLWVWNSAHRAAAAAASVFGSFLASKLSESALNLLHVEAGVYLALAACCYFAFHSLRTLVSSR